jgi:predicted porin
MKTFALSALSLTLFGAASAAHAQSSVTLYGVLDEAFQFTHNANSAGNNKYGMVGGNLQGNRWKIWALA